MSIKKPPSRWSWRGGRSGANGNQGSGPPAPDREALDIVTHILGGGPSSRLFQHIREERGLTYSTYAGQAVYADAGTLTAYAATNPEHAAEVLELLRAELEDLRSITADELEIAKGYLAGAYAMGIDVRASVLALANATAVPGRLEAVPGQRNFRIFVDYAHTDDALINVMKTLRELQPERLIVVFGCGGNRDRTKRPRMGAAVDQYADCAIITSDNPRKEDPEAIIEDIKPGFRRSN